MQRPSKAKRHHKTIVIDKREIADLEWDELDLERAIITLPKERTKNGRRHTIPLSAPALEILTARTPYADRVLVFGRTGSRGFWNWNNAKRKLDEQLKIAEPWIIHDLRRTAATGMAGIGIQPHVIEATLNHVSGSKAGVAGVYNRQTYEKEKTAALDRWAEHLAAVIEGRASKVTPLRKA